MLAWILPWASLAPTRVVLIDIAGLVCTEVRSPLAAISQRRHTFTCIQLRKAVLLFCRCFGTIGGWCQAYLRQTQVAWRPAPRGSHSCNRSCNGVGRCDYDTGTCRCSAGWTGPDCEERQDRTCQPPPESWREWQQFQRLTGLCAGTSPPTHSRILQVTAIQHS
jgi:hypothetical protein